ncbi:hypothetical protein ACSVIJ_12390 [Pseudomonas sp. NCHU5208]|uniref:hypothetical protein n=1 Tax=unclassified Pseudomonas TaxID=196821 RepID=UPI003F972506
MKSWFIRYLTKTSFTAIFITWSLVALGLAMAMQFAGATFAGAGRFSESVQTAMPWLVPLRILIYVWGARYWWTRYRTLIEASPLPDRQRRARNRIAAACFFYILLVEYTAWSSVLEVRAS